MNLGSEEKYIVLYEGKADFTLKENSEGKTYTYVSRNAYVASCLQSGTIIGYGSGRTVIELYTDRTLSEKIAEYKIIVLPGKNDRFPLFVNRWNGVTENREPKDLIKISKGAKFYSPHRDMVICRSAAEAYERMAEAAANDHIYLKMNDAYRSHKHQKELIEQTAKIKGIEETMKTAAPAGFSEHHTGLAMDISGAIDENGLHITENEDAYEWLANNCYRYGFMIKNLKGKEDITGTAYEPWHIRYIGDNTITKYLHDNELTLDEYIEIKSKETGLKNIDIADPEEYEYACLATWKSERQGRETFDFLQTAKEIYGIPFERSYNINLYNYSEKSCVTQSEIYKKEIEDNEKYYKIIKAETDMDKGEINECIAVLNENPYARVDLSQYTQLKMYNMDENELTDILMAIRDRRVLSRKIRFEFKKIDDYQYSYSNVIPMIAEYYDVTEKTLLDSDFDEFMETIEKCAPNLMEDAEKLKDVVVDMLCCKRLMGFWPFEYFMFDLKNKSLEERRKYVSNLDRTLKLNNVNNRISSEILDNKYLTYKVLEEFYGREIIMITSINDYDIFDDFVSRNKKFVKKPENGSMGSGIGLVEVGEKEDTFELLKRLLDDIGSFIAEEVIKPHKCLSKLNPDSVNTIRLTTYNDDKNVYILWPWLKVGRAGSFVDNSGAGGMGVAIDKDTGMLASAGMDEYGNSFDRHPDNGIEFRGYCIENWPAALELGEKISKALSQRIKGIGFVGWDITYTNDDKWVIVEGNAFPQLVQQATYGRGLKAELNEVIK